MDDHSSMKSENWYAPLKVCPPEQQKEPADSFPPAEDRTVSAPAKESSKKQKRSSKRAPSHGLTAGRAVGLCLILLLSIAASSLAFRRAEPEYGSGFSEFILPEERDEMPDRAKDFFDQYYKGVQSDQAQTDIQKTEEHFDLVLQQQKSGKKQLDLPGRA